MLTTSLVVKQHHGNIVLITKFIFRINFFSSTETLCKLFSVYFWNARKQWTLQHGKKKRKKKREKKQFVPLSLQSNQYYLLMWPCRQIALSSPITWFQYASILSAPVNQMGQLALGYLPGVATWALTMHTKWLYCSHFSYKLFVSNVAWWLRKYTTNCWICFQ